MRIVILFSLVCFLSACGGAGRDTSKSNTQNQSQTIAAGLRFGDSDPYPWPRRAPWNYRVHGIDVSKFQGQIDWRRVARGGISFAFIKATEGGDHLDDAFTRNWNGAARAGVRRGAYHFYYFCRSAIEQANWFIGHVPKSTNALPPVLDMEWNHTSRTCRYRPPAAQVRANMRVYLERVTQHYGQTPIIYSTPDFYQQNQLWRLRGYEFWLRSVAGHPDQVYPRRAWTFWQYTGTGRISGIEGNVDINVFRGGSKAWRNWR